MKLLLLAIGALLLLAAAAEASTKGPAITNKARRQFRRCPPSRRWGGSAARCCVPWAWPMHGVPCAQGRVVHRFHDCLRLCVTGPHPTPANPAGIFRRRDRRQACRPHRDGPLRQDRAQDGGEFPVRLSCWRRRGGLTRRRDPRTADPALTAIAADAPVQGPVHRREGRGQERQAPALQGHRLPPHHPAVHAAVGRLHAVGQGETRRQLGPLLGAA